MKHLLRPKAWLVLATFPAMMLAGCGNNAATAPTQENMQSFAPGMNNLSAEAKAAKAKNDAIARERLAEAAKKKP